METALSHKNIPSYPRKIVSSYLTLTGNGNKALMKNVLTPLAKSVLIPLGLTAAASATDAAIQKKIYGSGATELIISNEEMEDIMKIVKLLQESELLIKWISETIKNETKEQKGGFLAMLLGTLTTSILGSNN